MSEQFDPNDIGRVPFHELLNAAMPAIKIKPFIALDDEVLTAFRNTILGLDFKEPWQEVDIEFE